MSQPLWRKLVDLAGIDQKLNKLNSEIEETSERINKNQTIIQSLEQKISDHETLIKDHKKAVHSTELKLQEIDALEKKKRESLKAVQGEKEYKALNKELSVLGIERQDLEDILVTSMQELENSEKKLDSEKTALAEEKTKIQAEELSIKEKLSSLEASSKELLEEKISKSQDIPENWLTLYEKMKNKVENPVVSVMNTSCSHCFYHVLPQDYSKIKKGGLLHCKSCFRLLYYEVEDKSTATPEEY